MTPHLIRRAATGAALVLGACLAVGTVDAQEIYGDEAVFDRTPTVEELNAIFGATPAAGKPKVRTRKVVFGSPPPKVAPKTAPTPASTPASAPAAGGPAAPRTASLRIQFDLDSARVRSEYGAALANLAQSMRDNPSMIFEIGGHADATGDAGYNRDLSERRALAVRDYLINIHGVDGGRLGVAGHGESKLLPGLPPGSPGHRRVSFSGTR
ncbi:OmpA family protein [Marivibrio halodurans]|uniref:OmpA family protein n=1 Tax=Marivibrio halodurans TaxID=2039722 RepID=A0A8J7RZF3_9PROT|nr:OmpA family protein [Marivibrio halodurans]MBP5857140.1 OmpA family protein [Marivibrio halodurans]